MLFCAVPTQSLGLIEAIWNVLHTAGLRPDPLEECGTVELSLRDARTIAEAMRNGPIPEPEESLPFRVIPLRAPQGSKADHALERILGTILERSGSVPLWKGGELVQRQVAGTHLELRHLALLSTTRFRHLLRTLDPEMANA